MIKKIIPNISVDCVIFGFDFEKLNILLVERNLTYPKEKKTLLSDLTLTGYHILENEELDEAAARILYDLTGLDDIYLEQFYTFGNLNRLKNKNDTLWLKQYGDTIAKRVFSVGYFSLIDNTKVNIQFKNRVVKWYPVNEVENLSPIAFELLPEKFTLSQLQKLYEVILDKNFDKRNFRKKVSQMSFVIPIKEKRAGGAGKPAQLYVFSQDVYEKTKSTNYFSLNL